MGVIRASDWCTLNCWHNIMCLASCGQCQEWCWQCPGDWPLAECDVTWHCDNHHNNTGCQSPRGCPAWQHKLHSDIADTIFVTRDIEWWRCAERRGWAVGATSGAGAVSLRGVWSGQSRLWSRGPGEDKLWWGVTTLWYFAADSPMSSSVCSVSARSKHYPNVPGENLLQLSNCIIFSLQMWPVNLWWMQCQRNKWKSWCYPARSDAP